MQKYIDLRSDTFTKPGPLMREAMAEADVGDDVYEEDPTVNALQVKTAELFGMESSLFVCSGTMANQLVIKAFTQPGDEVIAEKNSHIINEESGAAAALSNVQLNAIDGKLGIMSKEQIEGVIRPDDFHYPRTRLICLENTHTNSGGKIYPFKIIVDINKLAQKKNLKMHLDGSRLFNASVATGISVKEYARYFNSVCFCLSKGLGCPIGSMIVGSAKLIERVRRFRKMFGGGMRQVGILAAAGLYALENHISRLSEDHLNAKRFAEGLNSIRGISIGPAQVETNIVIFKTQGIRIDADIITQKLENNGVRMFALSPNTIRAVTHLGVTESDIDKAVEITKKVLSAIPS